MYTEAPDVIWRTLIPAAAVVVLLVVVVLGVRALRRAPARRPILLGLLAVYVVGWLTFAWLLVAPVQTMAISRDGPADEKVEIQCGSPLGNAWLRGVPDDAALSTEGRACRGSARQRLTLLVAGLSGLTVVVGGVTLARPGRRT